MKARVTERTSYLYEVRMPVSELIALMRERTGTTAEIDDNSVGLFCTNGVGQMPTEGDLVLTFRSAEFQKEIK